MARKSKKRGKNKVRHKKYKLKTHKATAKRFKATGSGRIMRTKGHQGHLKRRRSKRAKRLAMEMFEVQVSKDRRTIKRLAPNIEKKNK